MKRIILCLTLILAASTAFAQTINPQQAPTCVNVYAGQPALQAPYSDPATGAVYPTAVWVVSTTRMDTTGKMAMVGVSIFANATAAQTCLKPVKQLGLTFVASAFTTAFGGTLIVPSGETFAQATVAQAIAAIKTNTAVQAQLANATSITL